MITRVLTAFPWGMEAKRVEVQIDLVPGVPAFLLVGLAGASLREASVRVRAALANSGLPFPRKRITINLAPAELRKEGAGLELAVAVGVVLANLSRAAPPQSLFYGQLALDGTIQHVEGVLVVARWMREHGLRTLFVAAADAAEASLAEGLTVLPCQNIRQVVDHLIGKQPIKPCSGDPPHPEVVSKGVDLAEVCGQVSGRRALEVAAAGAHHLLMTGPPGAGKTLLASCLPSILPPLTVEQALQLAQIRSLLGELDHAHPLDWRRPFRGPHHSISGAGLIGGGVRLARPGEISRALHGVLFLDELAEFPAHLLQQLRQPLEQARVDLVRAGGMVSYPCRFQLVAATNPCPCGWLGDAERRCRCTINAVESYRKGLSGPLLDRIDLQITIPRMPLAELEGAGGEASERVRQRVMRAQELQQQRQGMLNSALNAKALRQYAPLTSPVRTTLQRWANAKSFSARAYHRAWRVARSLADLEERTEIGEEQVMESLSYRMSEWSAAAR
ncbi:MAG: YifB family Mg chelatase-like AAA ATPase [Candidatus Dormibacteraceae bacterium]